MSENKLPERNLFAPTVETDENGNDLPAIRRSVYVEPEISVPVDVLEATTFFQAATSGATN